MTTRRKRAVYKRSATRRRQNVLYGGGNNDPPKLQKKKGITFAPTRSERAYKHTVKPTFGQRVSNKFATLCGTTNAEECKAKYKGYYWNEIVPNIRTAKAINQGELEEVLAELEMNRNENKQRKAKIVEQTIQMQQKYNLSKKPANNAVKKAQLLANEVKENQARTFPNVAATMAENNEAARRKARLRAAAAERAAANRAALNAKKAAANAI